MLSQQPPPKKYYDLTVVEKHRKDLFLDALEISNSKKSNRKKIIEDRPKEKL